MGRYSAFVVILVLTSSLLLLLGRSCAKAAPQARMVSSEATHISKVPSVVSVRVRPCDGCAYEHYCGGVIYSATSILTGANCVRDVSNDVRRLQVIAGTSYRTMAARDGRIYPVDRVTLHEDANVDLAIIHLQLPLQLNGFTIEAVPLATQLPSAGKRALVAGWGQLDELVGPLAEALHDMEVPIMDLAACRRLYFWTQVRDTELCAGYTKGQIDACQGDAGSPLLYNNELLGIVSWGYGCARANNPGVYTNIVSQRTWIATHA